MTLIKSQVTTTNIKHTNETKKFKMIFQTIEKNTTIKKNSIQ